MARTKALILASLLAASPLLGQSCPSGTVQNFQNAGVTCGSSTCSLSYTWSALAGAATYEVGIAQIPTFCSTFPTNFTLAGSTQGLGITINGVPKDQVHVTFVRAANCQSTGSNFWIVDTFQTPPAKTVLQAQQTAPDAVTVKYSQSDGKVFAVTALERALGSGSFVPIEGFDGNFRNYCPAGSEKQYVDSGLSPGTYRYRAQQLGSYADGFASQYSDIVQVTVGTTCSGSITCSAEVPSVGTVGQSINFQGDASAPQGCQGQPTYTWVFGDGKFANGRTIFHTYDTAGTYSWSLTASLEGATPCTKSGTIVIAPSGCPKPSTPAFLTPGLTLNGGQSYPARWSAPPELGVLGAYVLETSRDALFSRLESSVTTRSTYAIVSVAKEALAYDLYLRVRAVQACGAFSANSTPIKLTVTPGPPSFVITRGGPTWIASTTDAPPTGVVAFRNVGDQRGSLVMAKRGDDFFDVSPGLLDLGPGEEKTVTLTAKASALQTVGVKHGTLLGVFGTANSLATGVSLVVTAKSTPAGSRAGSKVRASVTTLVFTAPEGQNPPPKSIQISLDRIVGSDPLYLSPTIGPGGSWLALSAEITSPVPGSRVLNLTLSVDRSLRAPSDGPPPLRTLLSIAPVGGDADDTAVIEVIDRVPVPVASGTGRGSASGRVQPEAVTPPTGGSFIIPATVNATGANDSSFYTDGWLRNVGIGTIPVELYYTPRGKDGLTDSGVLKATTSVEPGTTLRLADLLGSLFQATGSGQVEVRSNAPSGLTLRTTVEAVTGGDPSLRFGTEIPTVSFGTGTGVGQGALILPGISDDAANRCNLIVAETTGASATFQTQVSNSDGVVLGSRSDTVQPYGQVQIDGIVKAIAGSSVNVTGGYLTVTVTGGTGKIVPLATVIDNKSNSFSAVKGSPVTETAARAPLEATGTAATPLAYIVPAAVKAGGAGGTQFVSSLSMVNGTAREISITMTYNYEDLDSGGTKTATVTTKIPPRGTLSREKGQDFLSNLMGVNAQSRGWMKMEGDVGAITAVAAISTLVDPADPSKGVKTAQVNGFLSDVPDVMAVGQTERRFAGMEKTVSKRSGLILVETAGQATSVRLRAYAATGQVLAEKTVSVGANQYYQINDFFSDSGMQLGEGPYQNVEVAAQVLSGDGKIVGIATVNDNISKNPEVFVMKEAGPPTPSIGF